MARLFLCLDERPLFLRIPILFIPHQPSFSKLRKGGAAGVPPVLKEWPFLRTTDKLQKFGPALDVSICSLNVRQMSSSFLYTDRRGVSDGADKKVIIAEEHKIVRDGLISLLRNTEGVEAVGEARDDVETVRLAERLRPDLVLMGLSITGMSGLRATKEIKKRFPRTKVLVLTTHDSEDSIRAAFKAGADGYCLKESGLRELLVAIESVLAGKVYFSPAISHIILHGYLRPDKSSKLDLLTYREKEVLKLLGGGHEIEEIASLLSISDKTVAKHKSNIMRKLDCHTASDLASFAIQVVL